MTPRRRGPHSPALRAAGLFLALGGGWILLTDLIVERLSHDAAIRSWLQHLKGILFVIGASLVVYLIARRRERSETELRESEAHFRALYENAPLGYQSLDAQGRILDVNRAWQETLGYERGEVIGRWFGELLPETQQALFRERFPRFKHDGHIHAVEFDLRRKDGTYLTVIYDGRIGLDSNGHFLRTHCILEDITERRRAELHLRRLNRALRTLSECNQALVRSPDESSLLQSICRTLVEQGGYPLAWIGFAGQDAAKTVLPAAHAGAGGDYLNRITVTWGDDPLGQGPVGRTIRTGEPVVVRRIEADPDFSPWFEVAREHGFGSIAALPLFNGDQVAGSLAVYAREPEVFDKEEMALLGELADDVSYGLRALHTSAERDRIRGHLGQALLQTVRAVARTVEARDPYTAGHQERVAELATAIATEIGWDTERAEGLRLAALIHDIGKIYIPAEILTRPGAITPIEMSLIRTHARVGFEIMQDVVTPWPLARAILQHHERLDGSGYPEGLTGDAILPEAQILAVADVVEAMASHRPYRPALRIEQALMEIEAGRGSRYNGMMVDACLRVFRDRGFRFSIRADDPA
ncbi:HD domain-containing phosphohydrolase [Thioalbus denitrificans]|uniref:PAS domain S-box-containing protein/putative nucleotidyltransferase with HDIG domain n=1 Tax=Thioalbus denitrificans TaxID=547122 RepID=A0A369CGA1_9GAMM|nr:HD domain-containing phosphohydrolase [Thioalbus denitrificans]RCX32723.1 PAS domain S-box-containing protein/putative nucleotidyltransferase with HDIG domain [Thioalbus denitrificans]